MSKQVRAGRARYTGRFSMVELLSRALRDLAPHTDLSSIMLALAADPKSVRGVISRELSCADLQKDSGGFARYTVLRQVEALVKKNPDFFSKTTAERKQAAMIKFHAAERRCARANRRLRFYSNHWSRAPIGMQILTEARGLISDVLGEFDSSVIEYVCDRAKFTTGSSYAEKHTDDLSLYAKLERTGTITADACEIAFSYLKRSPSFWDYLTTIGQSVKIVRGDRVSCVPKTWDTDRTIAVQPSWNVFLQKGIDDAMRAKLRHVGVNLSDQTLNHVPACIGSVSGEYATMDLSSASDTVARFLVEYLVPSSWYRVLDAVRCKEYTADGGKTWETYEKFSAMGNCCTFPLESLIFWAIAKVCCSYSGCSSEMLRVYGDDIVVPRGAFLLLSEALQFAGFEPNLSKSFALGAFRETCGSDFLYGVDIRPVYIKGIPRTVQDVYSMYNRLLLNRMGFSFPETLAYLLSLVDTPHRGPAFQLTGDAYWQWYAGKGVSYDNYFISEPPAERIYDYSLFTWRYSYKTLKRTYKRNNRVRDETVLKCLLRGYAATARVSNAFSLVQYTAYVAYWPSLKEALTSVTTSQRHRINAWY